MIGNLGKVASNHLMINDGNTGSNGNCTSKAALAVHLASEVGLPLHNLETGTPGITSGVIYDIPVIPERKNPYGNRPGSHKVFPLQHVTASTPGFTVIPVGNTDASDHEQCEKICYCCKGTDYWLGGTEKYPNWICRKCHPPVPGAERLIKNLTARCTT